jgi:type IV pilus assembly protein PilM
MGLMTGVTDFFGLDIGTTAIRVVQLHNSNKQHALVRYGHAPVDIKTASSDSAADQAKLIEAVINLVNATGITTRNVAVGLPAKRTFNAVVDFPKLAPAELKKTILYQAESHIPQPLSEVKLDWAVLGDTPGDPNKVEVLLSTVSNDFAESRLGGLEAAGFNVVALEPDPLALARSMVPNGTANPLVVLDVGSEETDLVIMLAGTPRLIRSIPTGGRAFVKAAIQNLNVDEAQAQQFVSKFGLSQNKLEGQVYKALEGTAESLVSEIDKSIKFFKTRYKIDLEKIVVTGGASTLPEFPLFIANKTGIAVEIGNCWSNISYPNAKYNDLIAISNQFGIAAGLGLRQE